jgi:serine/threonine-protein kinase
MKKISIYNVEDPPIGIGGMGCVYRGYDPQGNPVAIKEMRAEYVQDQDMRARFHQEIKMLSELEHTAIVKMFGSFEERGNLYLVMEFVEGLTIDQYVKRCGSLNENNAVRLMSEILSALSLVHEKGYVHRDIKPSNIMLQHDGKVCLLDFGIAKDMNRRNNGLTIGQLTIGTDGYMSPEQAGGYNIDHRSDIYSLGCVLYYMLVGSHAIEKQSNDYKTRMAILENDFPQAKRYNPNISDNTQRILDRATNKNMLQRFQSCREFELELRGEPPREIIISIGRNVGCDIKVHDIKVSGYHADIIRCKSGNFILRDKSMNGTFVKGQMVHHQEISIQGYGNEKIILANVAELLWNDIVKALHQKEQTVSGEDNPTTPTSSPTTPQPTPPPPIYEPKSATGWLVAIYIFAVLGGWLGVAFGISVYNNKVEFVDGKKMPKYKQSHRTAALIGAILSGVSMIIWITVMNI